MTEKIVLGLSGGVDSAVCGALLRRRGYEVHALYLNTGGQEALRAAEEAAASLGVRFRALDIGRALEDLVIGPFCREYARGRTPNPCVLCNSRVKLRALCDYADSLGARYIATGHYARVERGDGAARLLRAKSKNDQSYMLCKIERSQLQRLVLPLGDYEKAEVRALAREMGHPAAGRPDSMEICFVPDGDYAAFIEGRGVVPPAGNFVDSAGRILGRHGGIHRYTVGQRRGLGVATGERMYVEEIRPETNEILLSRGDGLFVTEFFTRDQSWLVEPPEGPRPCTVRVRHSRLEAPATVTPLADGAAVTTQIHIRAPAPGQTAAFYDGDTVLGGGTITAQPQ